MRLVTAHRSTGRGRHVPGLGRRAGGRAHFTPPVHYRVGGSPTDLESGDLNGDGLPDLVSRHVPLME